MDIIKMRYSIEPRDALSTIVKNLFTLLKSLQHMH